MMNSKWKLNRAGLVNFWYYDEEEFSFLDGRMLLRGANGSGKSVTMQSFIPLLLDGNMRPERLDPFGSRARKMENYLLEEDDRREERTGYLYMEVKREDSDAFLTFGIGMRARKNKKMDVWYFYLTDGRRIGKDFFLYKEGKGKIPCSLRELKYRVGDGGKVLETQREYAAAINQLLFGFETQEEYKELLELLIQLRTPKLSKDFKPTVINEILSSSLQTLSEDDLRPMSEAIENMDAIKTNLDILKEGILGAQQIEKVYDQYNAVVLYDKANLFMKSLQKCSNLEKEITDCREKIQRCRSEILLQEERYEALKREEEVLLREKESLSDSDAVKLKEQELKIRHTLAELGRTLAGRQKMEEEKKERRIETEHRISEQTEKNEKLRDEIEEYLNEMEDEIEGIPFDEFSFMKDELKENLQDQQAAPYDFLAHGKLLKDYTQKVEDGRDILLKEKECQEIYSRHLQELDELQKEKSRAERELLQYENLLHEVKQELIEQLYRWEKENQELHPEPEILQEISRRMEGYEAGTDYWEIKNLAGNAYECMAEQISLSLSEKNWTKTEAARQLKELQEELTAWRQEREPEPEISEEQKRNRALLKERNIPYTQLYKIIDFGPELEEAQKSKLEEALLRMGILSALIIPPEYREEVLALDEGTCDTYLFLDVPSVKENLLPFFSIENQDNNLFLYQNASVILSAIGRGAQTGTDTQMGGTLQTRNAALTTKADTWIADAGNYRLGILEGTITGQHEPCFIGSASRERYRLDKIRELEVLCAKKEQEIETITQEIASLEARKEKLASEWRDFPSEKDIKTAAREVERCEGQVTNMNVRLEKQLNRTQEARKTLDEVRLSVQEICRKCYLTVRLDVFSAALTSLHTYRETLTGLQLAHGNYRNGLHMLKTQEENLSETEADLDNILYDIGQTKNKIRTEEEQLASILNQLALTDYEQMKERLAWCMERLNVLPDEKEKSVEIRSGLRNQEKNLNEKLQEAAKENEKAAKEKQWCFEVFLDECRLHEEADPADPEYAAKITAENSAENAARKAAQVCRQYSGKSGNRKQSDILGALQEAYHRNRGYLQEYQLTMQTLFEERDSDCPFENVSVKRIEIYARYRGTSVKFKELLSGMEEDAQMQEKLLSDKDRELFEDILANTISKKIRAKIYASKRWVDKMNSLMSSMKTSSGLTLNLRWKNKRAETEEQLDTRALVELLQKDAEIMRPEETAQLSRHFRSKIDEARRAAGNTGNMQSFHAIMREVLDYRQWFEFKLECQKTGERKKELTDRVFFTFSGGEKAMAMYVPLFSAVAAKYAGARKDAPRLISLDEAFAGVDETNIRDMFRLMVEFDFNFMINSQILWGDYDTVPALAIYQLIRPENVKYVTVIRYVWNGTVKKMLPHGEEFADDPA